jgi:hypothetical protein
MSKIYHNPSIADLIQGIKEEDAGLTPKVFIKDLPKPVASITPLGSEYTAMQMALAQCSMYANLVDY